MNRRFLVIATLLFGVVALIVLLFFGFRILSTPPLPRPAVISDRRVPAPTPEKGQPLGEEQSTVQSRGTEGGKGPVMATFFGSTIRLQPPVMEELRPLLEAAKRIVNPPAEQREAPPEEIVPAPLASETTLTPDEVFRILYPDFYLDLLRKVQDRLVERGVIIVEKKFAFVSEEEVWRFNDILLADLLERKKISEEQYQAYLKGKSFLFDRPYGEKYQEALDIIKKFRKGQVRAQNALPVASGNAYGANRGRTLVAMSGPARFLLQILQIMPQEARAQECFKSGGGSGEEGGANFVATCCEGCEEDGIACLSTCPGAAIWDPATLICGCNY